MILLTSEFNIYESTIDSKVSWHRHTHRAKLYNDQLTKNVTKDFKGFKPIFQYGSCSVLINSVFVATL